MKSKEGKGCFICQREEPSLVYLNCRYEGRENLLCMSCLHPLIHGMSPQELTSRMFGQEALHQEER